MPSNDLRRVRKLKLRDLQMLEVLAEQLWAAQRSGKAPDEMAYLERLRGLV